MRATAAIPAYPAGVQFRHDQPGAHLTVPNASAGKQNAIQHRTDDTGRHDSERQNRDATAGHRRRSPCSDSRNAPPSRPEPGGENASDRPAPTRSDPPPPNAARSHAHHATPVAAPISSTPDGAMRPGAIGIRQGPAGMQTVPTLLINHPRPGWWRGRRQRGVAVSCQLHLPSAHGPAVRRRIASHRSAMAARGVVVAAVIGGDIGGIHRRRTATSRRRASIPPQHVERRCGRTSWRSRPTPVHARLPSIRQHHGVF